MELQPLRLGAAYHGNRMPHHAREDLLDMATHGMDLVVHMLSHTDWNRHLNVMKDIVSMSIDAGLEPWMDNWGLAGHPGDTSFFLAMHPESHMYYSNGQMEPVRPCLYSPEFRKFTKEWIDAVYFTGARTIFWDEPCAPLMDKEGRNVGGLNPNEKVYHSCACPRCRKLFEEQYGRPMPEFADKDTADFAAAAVVDYFREMTEYSASKGMKNVVCVMLGTYGMNLDSIDLLGQLPHMDNIGSDPYWVGDKQDNPALNVYEYVYKGTKANLRVSEELHKDHNIWLQTYANPRGLEEDIVVAAEAAYDAGARTIIAWGYYGSESNNYAAKNPAVTWSKTCEAMHRVRTMERDRILAENRKFYMK